MKTDLTLWNEKLAELTKAEMDTNFARLMYFNRLWTAGTYQANEAVLHNQNAWVVRPDVVSTTQEPSLANVLTSTSDWDPLSVNPWGFGELRLTIQDAAFPDLGLTYIPIDGYDQANYEQNTVLNAAAGTIAMSVEGVWEVQVMINIEHDEAQQGRTTNVRLSNVTAGQDGPPYPVGIGRNQTVTQTSLTFWTTIEAVGGASLDDAYRVEIGGGSTVQVDALNLARYAVRKIA